MKEGIRLFCVEQWFLTGDTPPQGASRNSRGREHLRALLLEVFKRDRVSCNFFKSSGLKKEILL